MNKTAKQEKIKELIDEVKRKLWTFGYGISDYSGLDEIKYDLIVKSDTGKFKVKVTEGVPESMEKGIDVYAIKDQGAIKFVFRTAGMIAAMSPYDAFGRPSKQVKNNTKN